MNVKTIVKIIALPTLLCAAVLIPVPAKVSAQTGTTAQAPPKVPEVTARITPDSILIGDHFGLEVEVVKDLMQVIGFPEFKDGKFTEKIEILNDIPEDTVQSEGRRITIRKKYVLTCFDEGIYELGRFPVLYVDKNIVDTLLSRDSLRIVVNTLPVDTLTQTIYDIKKPLAAPLRFGEFTLYLLSALLALAGIALAVWYLIRRKKMRSSERRAGEPAHVRAIRELERLHAQKLWQNNKHKQYYTGLTDILREYLEGRYGIYAMEMTSEEIMGSLSGAGLHDRNYARICEILKVSDLVKFAKYIPETDCNEWAYTTAYYFVEDTKPCEIEEPAAKEEEEAL